MKNIVLIGFMGSGKSTISVKLSYRLHITLEDTDKWIEKKEGRSISDIFARDGEDYFRQVEGNCIRSLLKENAYHVISTGGGMPVRKENRPLLNKLGHVIYLKAAPGTIWERLANDTTRPLLQCDNPQEKIKMLIEERDPYYREAADSIITVDGKDTEQILSEILDVLADKGILTIQERKE